MFLLWATSKPTSMQTAAVGLATTRLSAWSSEGFKKAFGAQAAEAALKLAPDTHGCDGFFAAVVERD